MSILEREQLAGKWTREMGPTANDPNPGDVPLPDLEDNDVHIAHLIADECNRLVNLVEPTDRVYVRREQSTYKGTQGISSTDTITVSVCRGEKTCGYGDVSVSDVLAGKRSLETAGNLALVMFNTNAARASVSAVAEETVAA